MSIWITWIKIIKPYWGRDQDSGSWVTASKKGQVPIPYALGMCPRRILLRNLTCRLLNTRSVEWTRWRPKILAPSLPASSSDTLHCPATCIHRRAMVCSPLWSATPLCLQLQQAALFAAWDGSKSLELGARRLISTLQHFNLGHLTPLTFGLLICKMGVRTVAHLPWSYSKNQKKVEL